MAGKKQANSASGSLQTLFRVISNYAPVRYKMEIAIVVFFFVRLLNYKRFRCNDNITWNAKMVAEHVGTIATRAWPIDGIPTGLSAHGYQASPRFLNLFTSLLQQRQYGLIESNRFLFAKLVTMERTDEDQYERTKTK